ncbi:MAG: hypothetical protein GY853_01420 [PVC group bacterium]|nr:hypothetical protein [PVC group bacterium]
MSTKEERVKEAQERLLNNYKKATGDGFSGKRQILDLDLIGGYRKDLFYKPEVGERPSDPVYNRIDILPYRVKTKNHPQQVPAGKEDYILDIWVHKNVGPSEERVLCLDKTFGGNKGKCPICEELNELEKDPDADKEMIKKHQAKHRCYYNIINLDAPESEAKVQLFEESYFLFENTLIKEAGSSKKGDGVLIFYDREIGKTVEMRTIQVNNQFGKFFKYERVDFLDREPYKEDVLDHTYSLDELLIVPTYEEVRNLYYGTQEVEEEEKPVDTEPKDAPVGASPFQNRGAVAGSTAEVVEVNDADSERRTRRERARVRPTEDNPCPYGHDYGRDNGNKSECRNCDDAIWQKCADEFDKLDKKDEG